MISVVLTTYNGQDYIEEQLDSIFHQTRMVDELIICDDVSKDRTVVLIQEYIQKHPSYPIQLHVNEKNLGYKKNFIQGMSMSSGDYVFLSDQDDIWCSNKVEIMLEAMKNPQIQVLASSFEYVNEKSEPLHERTSSGFNNDRLYNRQEMKEGDCVCISFKELLRENYFQGASLCLRKNIVNEVVHSYKDYITHDWFINFTAAKYEGMYFLNTVLFQYRIHEKNNLGIPSLNNSWFAWFAQANQEEKRLLAFDTSLRYLLQLQDDNDSYYVTNHKELKNYVSFFQKCIDILKQRRVLKWVGLINNANYKYFRNKKGMVMDFLFILTHMGK